jgi:glycerol kinase
MFPFSGWVEQDPLLVWRSVQHAINACLEKAGNPVPAGIAITNQRESVLVWERTGGKPVGPVVTWQCRRSSPFCDALQSKGLGPLIKERTGLPIDPLFSASKIRWLLDHVPNGQSRAERGALCAGTMDSWVLWNLTGGKQHGCDVSNASRTQLLNLRSASWDDRLLDVFNIPPALLPEVKASSAHFGETVEMGSLSAGRPIVSMIGDSHAALFGQGGFQPGIVKATYGTGSSLMSPLSEPTFSRQGIVTTVAWGIDQEITYALEGNISVTGSAVEWYANLLGLDDPAKAAALASQTDTTDGLYIVPAFVGLGAPYWNEKARGLVTGITRNTSAAHFARAVLESIGFQIRDVFDAMAHEASLDLKVLLADGGGSRSDLLMQIQADILGYPVLRNNAGEISALGAAYLAGLKLGFWKSTHELAALPRSLDRFEPRGFDAAREAAYAGWKNAVARTLYDPERG